MKVVPRLEDQLCCPVHLYNEYLVLRPQGSERFSLQFRGGRFVNEPIGKCSLGEISKRMAKDLGLKGRFSAHCFRTSAATAFIENGGTKEALQRLGDWRSPSACDGYVRNSRRAAYENAELLAKRIRKHENFGPENTGELPVSSVDQVGATVFSGCTFNGCVFNSTSK